jgi:hypothetical protein
MTTVSSHTAPNVCSKLRVGDKLDVCVQHAGSIMQIGAAGSLA